LRASPIALHTQSANEQPCEPPAGFFQKVLGRRLKYSSCWWPEEVKDLETAEAAMLALTCERAELGFDQDILELGCGWGSLTLWMAEFYPDSRIVAVSNSHSRREFIETCCRERGFDNVQVVTADMNDFHTDRRFDRVVAVELFEPTHNNQKLMARIHAWLKPGGKLSMQMHHHRLRVLKHPDHFDYDRCPRVAYEKILAEAKRVEGAFVRCGICPTLNSRVTKYRKVVEEFINKAAAGEMPVCFNNCCVSGPPRNRYP
jgi:cyclopropane fatty-acyl-phospholipid synthase-like methyltransferase